MRENRPSGSEGGAESSISAPTPYPVRLSPLAESHYSVGGSSHCDVCHSSLLKSVCAPNLRMQRKDLLSNTIANMAIILMAPP